jgi:hypothetical protein
MVRRFDELWTALPWRPIHGCPGRYVTSDPTAATRSPAALVGADAPIAHFVVACARDPVWVAPLAGGGLLSYARPDGTWVHTLNDADGWRRKLTQLGIAPPAITGG